MKMKSMTINILDPRVEKVSDDVWRLTKEYMYECERGHALAHDMNFDLDVNEVVKEELAKFKGIDKRLLEPITSLKEAIERKKAIKQYKHILDEGGFYTYYMIDLDDVIDNYKFHKSKLGKQMIAMYQWCNKVRNEINGRHPFELIYVGRYLWGHEMDFMAGGIVSSAEEEAYVKQVIDNFNPPYPLRYKIWIGEKFEVSIKNQTITPLG